MTAPTVTPLLLVSEFNAATNQSESTRLLDQIIHASSLLQGACRRRFDEYVDTKRYNAELVIHRGDLISWYRLALGADLRSLTTLAIDIPFGGVIGDGTAVTSSDIVLCDDVGGASASCGREIAVDEFGGAASFLASGNPYKSIGVLGLWGFGGRWINTTRTVSGLASSTAATSATVSSATGIEAGQVWRIGTEYLYVNTLATTTATVDRAYNGSTAAVHPDGTAIYYWQAHPLVQKLVRRLVQWDEKQKEFVMSQNLAVGDFSFPVATDGLPKDVFDTINQTGLRVLQERIVKA